MGKNGMIFQNNRKLFIAYTHIPVNLIEIMLNAHQAQQIDCRRGTKNWLKKNAPICARIFTRRSLIRIFITLKSSRVCAYSRASLDLIVGTEVEVCIDIFRLVFLNWELTGSIFVWVQAENMSILLSFLFVASLLRHESVFRWEMKWRSFAEPCKEKQTTAAGKQILTTVVLYTWITISPHILFDILLVFSYRYCSCFYLSNHVTVL